MAKNSNKPSIRFKGFTDAWEQRKLGDLGKAQSGIGFPDKEQGGKTGIPFFKVSDMNNVGNELEMNRSNNYVSPDQIKKNGWSPIEETSVIFAKVGAAIMLNRKRLVRFPFLLDNNTMAYKFSDSWDIEFGRTLFERIDLTSLVQVGALPSYNAGDVENMEAAIPQMAEQYKLGALFKSLDNLITLHQRKYEKFVNIKKALLEKMFPQGDEKVPRIRFRGFTDAWEQRKLGDLGKAQSGIGFPDKEQGGKTGIPFFKVSDMNNVGNELEMNRSNNYVSPDQIKKNGWSPIEETSVIFAKVGAAIMLNRKRLVRFPFLLDNNTMAYKFSDSWDIEFGRTLFERIDLTSLVQVGALPSYNAGDVENMEAAIPQMAEQYKLGALFKSLDNLITLHQRQVEKLKNIKSALLEKMFV